MKLLFSIVVAAVVSFGASYLYVSQQSELRVKALQSSFDSQRAEWESDRSHLESALVAARNANAIPLDSKGNKAATSALSAEEILAKLTEPRSITGTNRNHSIRQVIHLLESLVDIGPSAATPIRQFLARNQDVDFIIEQGPNTGASFWTWRRGQPLHTDYVLPPTLRLGLMDTLKNIGGDDAEISIAFVINTSGRGVEVAYATWLLEAMSPGKYREVAIKAAKDLLANLPKLPNPTLLDEKTEAYLYGILQMYNDASYISSAQNQLLNHEGKVDTDVLAYLSSTAKGDAMPEVFKTYNDPRVTDRNDKLNLMNYAMNYVGPNTQANDMFKAMISNGDVDPRMRAFAVMILAGGDIGPEHRESPTDPAVIKARQELLSKIQSSVTDPRIQQAISLTTGNLQNLLDGKPVSVPASSNPFGASN